MASHQKLTVTDWKQSSKLILLKLHEKFAKELSVDHAMVIWHLKQIGIVIKFSNQMPHELTTD